MKAICRILFIVLFVLIIIINGIYDVIMLIIHGEDHEVCFILNWLYKKLVENNYEGKDN